MSGGIEARRVKVTRPKKRKSGTVTAANHRFESFSQRVSKLKIDPIRRTRDTTAADDVNSYFRSSFDEWKDLNLSENFRAFVSKLEPLCYNLPQIVHYKQDIFELLIEYLSLKDALSLEPLLSLSAHFAHDLGVQFEPYFGRILETIRDVAASHQDVAVIEWAFSCLAWLFKYLSRLLVQDLRPVYDLMAPLLGKTRQKYFITQFAAESLSFLLRKAAARYTKDQIPLTLIIDHVLDDYASVDIPLRQQYLEGVVHLFVESIKGVQRGVSATGPTTCLALIASMRSRTNRDGSSAAQVLDGILVSTIHQTDEVGFHPILETALTNVKMDTAEDITMSLRILYTVSAARKGSRVSAWTRMLDLVLQMVKSVNDTDGVDTSTILQALKTVTVMFQYAPLDVLQPRSPKLLPELRGNRFRPYFLRLCVLCAKIGQDRFQLLLSAELQDYISSEWQSSVNELALYLPDLARAGLLGARRIVCPSSWQVDIAARFDRLSLTRQSDESEKNALAACNSALDLLDVLEFSASTLQSVELSISKMLQNELPIRKASLRAKFLAGRCLVWLSRSPRVDQCVSTAVLIDLATASTVLHLSTHYMRGFSSTFKVLIGDADRPQFTQIKAAMIDSIIQNLSCNSHNLRVASLDLLHDIVAKSAPGDLDVVSTMQNIEDSPVTVEHSRAIAMDIRRLPQLYRDIQNNDCLRCAVPAYLFGIFYIRLAPLWDEAAEALRVLSTFKSSEELVLEKALHWLQQSPNNQRIGINKIGRQVESKMLLQNYQCSNMLFIDEAAEQHLAPSKPVEINLMRRFDEQVALENRLSSDCRTQALHVLERIPQAAERKSRVLVPLILDWTDDEDVEDAEGDDTDSGSGTLTSDQMMPQTAQVPWKRKNKLGLLAVFAKFVNPGVLYRSDEVYMTMLSLLSNGDVDMQRAALKVIFTWKSKAVRPYEEHLQNLLDDVRFRDELAVFLNVDRDESEVLLEHRVALQPLLLNILYGRAVARGKTVNGTRGQEGKRRAIILALERFGHLELRGFIEIALGLLKDISILQDGALDEALISSSLIPVRRQLGIIKMIKDLLTTLSTAATQFQTMLLNAILYCVVRASRILKVVDEVRQPEKSDTIRDNSLLRTVRQEGIQCLTLIALACPEIEWKLYAHTILNEIVTPSLLAMPLESVQNVPSLFRLISAWTAMPDTIDALMLFDSTVLGRIVDCIANPVVDEQVKIYVLKDIFKQATETTIASKASTTQTASWQDFAFVRILDTGLLQTLMERIVQLLQQNPGKACIETCVSNVVSFSAIVATFSDVSGLVKVCSNLLRTFSRVLNPKMKGELLVVLERALSQQQQELGSVEYSNLLQILGELFAFFKDLPNRSKLTSVFKHLTANDPALHHVAQLCACLNAVSSIRATEPDYDVRLTALNEINDQPLSNWSPIQWHPIVHNLVFLVQDDEELAMRSSASLALRRFVQAANQSDTTRVEFEKLMQSGLMTAIQKSIRGSSELVRAEHVNVLAEAVRCQWPSVADMRILLGPDEESAVLSNLLHIQHHRRARAIRRLGSFASSISVENLWRFCLPLLETFISNEEVSDHTLANEAIGALELLSSELDWNHCRLLLQRKTDEASKFDSRLRIRALQAVSNALFNVKKDRSASEPLTKSAANGDNDTPQCCRLAKSLPDAEGLRLSLSNRVLKRLMECIHFRDESTLEYRVMVASVAVKLTLTLPAHEIEARLPAIINDVGNVLRSKAQEARDSARNTLSSIATLIGPSYFGAILTQLRGALQRGSQLHVLGFTVHTLLVDVAPSVKTGQLDYCAQQIIDVIMDETFGATGQEKEASEYRSRMREVKSKTHHFDTMELLASLVGIELLPALLQPLQIQLNKPKPRIEKITEMLRRLREGLRKNERSADQKLLIICFQLLNAMFGDGSAEKSLRDVSSYKTVAFAFDLLRRILDKHEHLKTSQNLSGFVPLIELSLKQPEEEIQEAVLRLLTSIIKVPMAVLDERAGDFIKLTKRIVEASSSTGTPCAQAALRLAAAILRERPYAIIKKSYFETHVAYLLKRIKPDLQEPAREGDRDRHIAAFVFLRAVISRGEMLPEIFDVMDVVREVMITSADDLARDVYGRFVIDYFPEEGKGLSKQLDFLIKNLQYTNPQGRKSIMNVISFIITKKDNQILQHMITSFFLPLVLLLAVDEDEDCRKLAGLLVQKLFERADKDRARTMKNQLSKWTEGSSDIMWQRVGFLCWARYFDANDSASEEAKVVKQHVVGVIGNADATSKGQQTQLLEATMDLSEIMIERFTHLMFATDTANSWLQFSHLIQSPHDKIRLSAARLLGLYFADLARSTAKRGQSLALPLIGSEGLSFDQNDAMRVLEQCSTVLQDAEVSDGTREYLIQNLMFIGRVCGTEANAEVADDLLSRVCAIVRTESQALGPRTAAIKLLHGLGKAMSVESLRRSTRTILLALNNIVDPSAATAVGEEMSGIAHELLSFLQDKLGATQFLAEMQQVQNEVRERREERRAKRRIEAVNDPERAGREKARRHEKAKVKRKEKNAFHAARRRGY